MCGFATLAACGGGNTQLRAPDRGGVPGARAVPHGSGPRFAPASLSARSASGASIAGLRCGPAGRRFAAHLELFAAGRVLLVPAGIGMAPPRRRDGAYVRSARCSYPLRTREPTGVIEVSPRRRPFTLGELFAIWGQPLSRRRLCGWRAGRGRGVAAFVGGRRYRGDPRTIALRQHAQIVLEVGPRIAPHARYRFPLGL